MFRAYLAAIAAATAAAVLTSVAVPSPAIGTEGSDSLTISVSDPSVKLGKVVVVSGKGPSLRRLVLQLRTRENGWQQVASLHTGVGGRYAFHAPDWEGTHQLRVVAPATTVFGQEVSRSVTVTVRMPYAPKGSKTDWAWMSNPGSRWNPCRPIGYRVNARGGYAASVNDLRRTFSAVGRVTGFRFRYLGRTGAQVKPNRYDYFPQGTDIVVDWQAPGQRPELAGRTAGLGGHWVLGKRRFDGYMVLDQTVHVSRVVWRQMMTHELGHILGLGHARARTQLMYGTSTQQNRLWGNGDISALRRVGASQGCLHTKRTDRPLPGTGPVPVSDS